METQIQVPCPHCRTRLKLNAAAPDAARLRVRCPTCGETFVLRRREASGPSNPTIDARRATTPPTHAPQQTAGGGPPGATKARQNPGSAAMPGAPPGESVASTFQSFQEGPSLRPEMILAERYRIVRFLAKGGMGEVYEAEDRELRERVALKTVRPEVARDATAIDRFKREIQLARRVTHPNVCRIYDVFFHRFPDGGVLTFLTMELLEGETLGDLLERQGPLSPEEALPLVRQMAAGLQSAHRVGIVHRDFKSRNVVLVPDTTVEGEALRAVITDFGLARGAAGIDAFAASLTVAGGVLGTPAYMAPEQIEGGEITGAVDLYALGVVLFELLTGEIPFQAENAISTAVKRLQEPAPSPRTLVPDLDVVWEETILRCLARYPEDRFPDAGAVVAALEAPAATPQVSPSRSEEMTGPTLTALSPSPGAAASSASSASSAASATRSSSRPPGKSSIKVPPRRERLMVVGLVLLIALIGAFGVHRILEWRQEQRLLNAPAGLPGSVQPRPAIAILGFRAGQGEEAGEGGAVVDGAAENGWVGTALGEMLAAELAAGGDLRVVPGDAVARMQAELALDPSGVLDPSAWTYARTLLGADYLVVGSYRATGSGSAQQLQVDLQLHDVVAAGETLGDYSSRGSAGALFELVASLGQDLRQALGMTPQATDSGALRALLPSGGEAARLYAGGLERLRGFDPVGANDLLQRAVQADPDNPMARSALSSSWVALGYRQRALEEAERAFQLSGALPSEERLWVEARYRELAGEWPQAETLYRNLWNTYPDDRDYGLQLAAVQTAAGKPAEATATVEALRRLVSEGEADPRVELAAAAAAAARGNVADQLQAARRAAEVASAQGARLLSARARVTECWALRNLGKPVEALEACRAGEEQFAAAGDSAGVAFALTNLANLRFDQGELDAARQDFERARDLYQEVGDAAGTARALNNLAVIHKQQGDVTQAQALYGQALELCQQISNEGMAVYALHNLGGLAMLTGRLTEAEDFFRQSRQIYQRIGDLRGEASSLDSLAVVLRKRGEMDAARAGHEQALEIRRNLGDRIGEATSLVNLGRVYLRIGDLPQARESFRAALELGQEIDNRSVSAEALDGLSGVLRGEGDRVSAEVRQREALDIREALGERGNAAESRLALAFLALESREPEVAVEQAMAAATEMRREGRDDDLAVALAVQGAAELLRRQPPAARTALEEAYALIQSSENLEARLPVTLIAARVAAALGRPAVARERVEEVLRQAEGRFKAEELAARLLSARARSDQAALALLAREAESLGYRDIARQAATP